MVMMALIMTENYTEYYKYADNKPELQSFVGIMNYQIKFSPATAEIC